MVHSEERNSPWQTMQTAKKSNNGWLAHEDKCGVITSDFSLMTLADPV